MLDLESSAMAIIKQALKTPFSRLLLPLARVPFQAKESVHKLALSTSFGNFQLTRLKEFGQKSFCSQAPNILDQFSAHMPPNLEIFSSQAPKILNVMQDTYGYQIHVNKIFPLDKPQYSETKCHFGQSVTLRKSELHLPATCLLTFTAHPPPPPGYIAYSILQVLKWGFQPCFHLGVGY